MLNFEKDEQRDKNISRTYMNIPSKENQIGLLVNGKTTALHILPIFILQTATG